MFGSCARWSHTLRNLTVVKWDDEIFTTVTARKHCQCSERWEKQETQPPETAGLQC